MKDEEVSAIDIAIDLVDELYAVEMLEYHNKNWLSGGDGLRSIDKMSLLKELKNTLKKIEKNDKS